MNEWSTVILSHRITYLMRDLLCDVITVRDPQRCVIGHEVELTSALPSCNILKIFIHQNTR